MQPPFNLPLTSLYSFTKENKLTSLYFFSSWIAEGTRKAIELIGWNQWNCSFRVRGPAAITGAAGKEQLNFSSQFSCSTNQLYWLMSWMGRKRKRGREEVRKQLTQSFHPWIEGLSALHQFIGFHSWACRAAGLLGAPFIQSKSIHWMSFLPCPSFHSIQVDLIEFTHFSMLGSFINCFLSLAVCFFSRSVAAGSRP